MKQSKILFILQESVISVVLTISEACCYLSSALSALIAFKLLKMDKFVNLNFLNQMFFLYYFVDSFLAVHEAYYLFRIYDEQ